MEEKAVNTHIQNDPEQDDSACDRIRRVILDLEAAVYILDLSDQARHIQEEGNRQMHRVLQELLRKNISRLEQTLLL